MALPSVGLASGLSLFCSGQGWSLSVDDTQAEFVFPAPTQMDIPHVASAEGAEWPRAMTLIGDRDTAIVVLHRRDCGGQTYEAQVLTQRGQSPILLTGCCEDAG